MDTPRMERGIRECGSRTAGARDVFGCKPRAQDANHVHAITRQRLLNVASRNSPGPATSSLFLRSRGRLWTVASGNQYCLFRRFLH